MKKTLASFTLLFAMMSASAQTRIAGIEAKLFYNAQKQSVDGTRQPDHVSGTFSQNVIDGSDFMLWNTIIGEGSAAGYSNQTIVVVKLASGGVIKRKQILRLTATANKKTLLKQEHEVSFIADLAKEKVDSKTLFLLNSTGCEPVTLNAEILEGGKTISRLAKKIDFACGE